MTDETLPGAEAAAVAALTQIQNSEPDLTSAPPADKPEGEGEETGKLKHGSPRDAMYADLVKRRREAVNKEIGVTAPAPAPPPQEEPVDEEGEEEVRVFPEDPDGFVGKVSRAEIKAAGGKEAYGKKVAADIVLQRQKEALRRVKEEEARIQKEREELERLKQAAVPQVPDKAPSAVDDLTDEEKAEIDHYREEYGDDVAKLAERSIRAIRGAGKVPQLDVNEITQKATTNALQEIQNREYQAQLKAADKAFSEQFGHLEADPKLRQLAIEEYKDVVKRNPNLSPVDAALQAGKNVEAWLASQGVKQDPAMAAKVAAKRTMTTPPASAGTRMPATPEAKPATPSDIIRNMRAARGLPT